MSQATTRLILALAVSSALAGCSSLDLSPEPSTYVGRSRGEPVALTDANLQAVTPSVPGDNAQTDPDYEMPDLPGQGTEPSTMPAATQPTTTRPSTNANPQSNAALGSGATSRPAPANPALGHADVPEQLSVQDAILVGLQNNINLTIQRFNVPITRTEEEIQRARFDPNVSGSVGYTRAENSSNFRNTTTGRTHVVNSYSDSITGSAAISEFLPTGTTITGALNSSNAFDSNRNFGGDASISISQALLRGAGLNVNLASLRAAEVNTRRSEFELRALAESTVANIEFTYWNLAYAERQVVIVQNALAVAQAQLDSVNENIRLGKLAESERAAAVAQVESEKSDLINAKSNLETTRLQFLRLITPAGVPFWNRTITLQTLPFVPTGPMDPVSAHIQVAMKYRPEINETKLDLQRDDLIIVQTRNGLLPQLDFFAQLGKTLYTDNFRESPDNFATVGIRGSYDLGNRAARAEYRSSLLSKEQNQQVLDNYIQQVNIDVRTQYIEVERTRQQIDATRATREADEVSLRVEQEKLNAGRSTSLLVAQAQQTLLSAQLAEVQSVTGHLQALVELYRREGSLLFRRGLEAPGAEPVTTPAWH